MAGRKFALKRSLSRKIWPSVIEMTLVGTNADTSPAWVSMMGSAVSDPVRSVDLAAGRFPSMYFGFTRAARSRSREWR